MPDDELDPGATTQMFQAFVDRAEPEPTTSPALRIALVGGVLAALVIVLALAWYLLAG